MNTNIMTEEDTDNVTEYVAGIQDRYIRWRELKAIVPLCRSRIDVLERQGKFPKRRKIGGIAVAWLESEVKEWMQTRIEPFQDAS